jgi:hypothetical protein
MLNLETAATPYQPVVISATAALIAALISGLFNLYNNSLRRFSGQRWWELKAHRYTELFDALFDVELYSHRRVEELTGDGSFQKEYYGEALRQRHFRTPRNSEGGGNRLCCLRPHASAVISDLQNALDAPTHNWTLLEEAEEHLAAVRKAKEKLWPIALKDLDVK